MLQPEHALAQRALLGIERAHHLRDGAVQRLQRQLGRVAAEALVQPLPLRRRERQRQQLRAQPGQPPLQRLQPLALAFLPAGVPGQGPLCRIEPFALADDLRIQPRQVGARLPLGAQLRLQRLHPRQAGGHVHLVPAQVGQVAAGQQLRLLRGGLGVQPFQGLAQLLHALRQLDGLLLEQGPLGRVVEAQHPAAAVVHPRAVVLLVAGGVVLDLALPCDRARRAAQGVHALGALVVEMRLELFAHPVGVGRGREIQLA